MRRIMRRETTIRFLSLVISFGMKMHKVFVQHAARIALREGSG